MRGDLHWSGVWSERSHGGRERANSAAEGAMDGAEA